MLVISMLTSSLLVGFGRQLPTFVESCRMISANGIFRLFTLSVLTNPLLQVPEECKYLKIEMLTRICKIPSTLGLYCSMFLGKSGN